MTVFEALGVTGSGMHVHKMWMDAISDNVANVNTIRPMSQTAFQSRYVIAQSVEDGGIGSGVAVTGIQLSSAQGRVVYDPTHPMADKNGLVRLPDVDLAEQLTTMIMAQRGYQANISNLDRVKGAYEAAIQMGRGA
jgi:flagellar basal-body rod protein FlgC